MNVDTFCFGGIKKVQKCSYSLCFTIVLIKKIIIIHFVIDNTYLSLKPVDDTLFRFSLRFHSNGADVLN